MYCLNSSKWVFIYLFFKIDTHQPESLFCGYKSGELRAFDIRQNGIFWKYSSSDGVCGLDFSSDKSMIVSKVHGKYDIFRLEDMNGLHLPLVSSVSNNVHPQSRSTVWNGCYSPFHPEKFMLTTNDGYLSLCKQYVK